MRYRAVTLRHRRAHIAWQLGTVSGSERASFLAGHHDTAGNAADLLRFRLSVRLSGHCDLNSDDEQVGHGLPDSPVVADQHDGALVGFIQPAAL